jgi:hypothetical protein
MSSRHARIQVPADPELEVAVARGRQVLGLSAPASQVVRALALRGAAALDEDDASRERATDFLVSVAEGTSGLDLERLRTVRDRTWR